MSGNPLVSSARAAQQAWCPGLGNGARRLCDVYESIPGDVASSVPWAVRLLENPRSLLALPGAIDLLGHDCIHVLLGRGLLAQDEAFVLGFTMGSSRAARDGHARAFCWCAEWIYRGPYRFGPHESAVFRYAFAAARAAPTLPAALDVLDYRRCWTSPLVQLRQQLRLDPAYLRRVYAFEARRWPEGAASERLAQL